MEISEIIKKDEVVKRKKGRPRKEINKDVEQKFPEEKKKRGRKKKEVQMSSFVIDSHTLNFFFYSAKIQLTATQVVN